MRDVLTITFFLLLSASGMAETWQERGNYSIRWYDAGAKQLTITTAEELAGLAYLVNNGYDDFNDKTLVLSADIDLRGKEWIPIGHNKARAFRGNIDGAGYYIFGMSVATSEVGGLLGHIYDAEVKNLDIMGNVTVTNTGKSVGGIAAIAEKCSFSACNADIDISYLRDDTFSSDYEVSVGGMIGEATDCSFSSCIHDGNINGQLGNLDGTSPEYYTSGHLRIGGIAGYAENCQLEFCGHGAGSITTGGTGSRNSPLLAYTGGIIGQAVRCGIMSCRNNTTEFLLQYRGGFNVHDAYAYVGGIAGYYLPCDEICNIANCYSSTNVVGGNTLWEINLHFGGIVGSIDNDDEKYCKANYSASDMEVEADNIKVNNYGTYDGSTAFSSADMKTDDFLDELNLLPMIEYGHSIWVNEGGYPFVKIDNTQTTVRDAQTEEVCVRASGHNLILSKATDVRLFNMDGRQAYSGYTDRITGLPYGIYVLRIDGTTLKIALH